MTHARRTGPDCCGAEAAESSGRCPLLGRRQFLARVGAAGGALLALRSGLLQASARRVLGAPMVPGDGEQKPRIMVGFARPDIERYLLSPGAGFPLDENQQLFTRILTKAAEDLGVTLDIEPKPLVDNNAMDAFLEERAANADGAILTQMGRSRRRAAVAHFLQARPDELPTIVYGPQGTRTWLVDRAPRSFIGTTDDADWLATALRTLKARWQMANTRLAVIAGDDEREEVLEPLGTVIHRMPLEWLEQAMRDAEGSEEAHEIAARCIENAEEIVEPSEAEILKAAENYVANRRLMAETGAHAVTTDCLGLVRRGDGSDVQCLAYCLLLDEGTCGACEMDIYPAMALMLSSYLLGRPGFMSNPAIHTVTNEYVQSHCQVPTRMDGFDEPPHPYRIRPHHETQQGVTLQIDFRENQPATLLRFLSPGVLGVDTGVIRRSMRPEHHEDGIGGCQNGFSVAVDGLDDVRNFSRHSHPVMVYGTHRETLRAWCEVAGIDLQGIVVT